MVWRNILMTYCGALIVVIIIITVRRYLSPFPSARGETVDGESQRHSAATAAAARERVTVQLCLSDGSRSDLWVRYSTFIPGIVCYHPSQATGEWRAEWAKQFHFFDSGGHSVAGWRSNWCFRKCWLKCLFFLTTARQGLLKHSSIKLEGLRLLTISV